jgi:hypothetical protein
MLSIKKIKNFREFGEVEVVSGFAIQFGVKLDNWENG